MRLSRMTISEMFTIIKRRIFRVEAVFIRSSRLRKRITVIMNPLVMRIDMWGVLNFR